MAHDVATLIVELADKEHTEQVAKFRKEFSYLLRKNQFDVDIKAQIKDYSDSDSDNNEFYRLLDAVRVSLIDGQIYWTPRVANPDVFVNITKHPEAIEYIAKSLAKGRYLPPHLKVLYYDIHVETPIFRSRKDKRINIAGYTCLNIIEYDKNTKMVEMIKDAIKFIEMIEWTES
jgi:hypothetical protein